MPNRTVIRPAKTVQKTVAPSVQSNPPLRLGTTQSTAQRGEVLSSFARNDTLKTRVTIRAAPVGGGGASNVTAPAALPDRPMTPREMLGSLTERRAALEAQGRQLEAELRSVENAIGLAEQAVQGGAHVVELDAQSIDDDDDSTPELLTNSGDGDEEGFPLPSPRASKATLLESVEQWNNESPDQAIEVPEDATNAVIYELLETAVHTDDDE